MGVLRWFGFPRIVVISLVKNTEWFRVNNSIY